jgi:peptide/nickel transport system substrate-binding protein
LGFDHQQGHSAELEPLYYYSAFADKTYPWLAESHVYNDDATEITFHIRQEAEWSDGTPFTAADVAFTVQMLIDRAPLLRNSAELQKWVRSVEAVDETTVHFALNEPNWRFHFYFFTFRFDLGVYLVPKHIYEDVENPEAFEFYDVAKGWPVVTGAYQTTVFEPALKYFDLRYEWWAAKAGLVDMPRVERIAVVPIIERTAIVQSIVRNEIDISHPDLLPSTVKSALDQAPHLTTFSGDRPPYGYLDWWPVSMMFNVHKQPYDDPRVRWAVAYAIDQQQLVDVGWGGAGEPTALPYPHYPSLMPYLDSIQGLLSEYNVLEHNLQKVEDLMGKAGFARDGEGFWADSEGARPDADILAIDTAFGDIAPLLAEQLRTAGFDARHIWPVGGWEMMWSGEATLFLFGHLGSIVDPYATLALYHSDNPMAPWADPAFDAIVDEMAVTPMGDPKIFEQFHSAMEIWLRILSEVPLVQWYHRVLANTTYWANWPSEENPYINTTPVHLTFPLVLWNLRPVR